jgi:hypothetical protein
VYHTDQVIHLWAQQSTEQPCARNAKATCWFAGDTLYSYNTTIARFVNTVDNDAAVLISSEKYSLTTSGQQSSARNAVHHIRKIFVASHIDCLQTSLNIMIENYRKQLEQFQNEKLRAPTRAVAYESAHFMRTDEIPEFIRTFGLPSPVWPELPPDSFSKYTKLRDKSAAICANKAARLKAKDDAYRELMVTQWPEAKAAFLDGKTKLTYPYQWQPCLLRLDGDEILTSWGASFPTDHAARAFKIICEVKARCMSWSRSDDGPRLGHFTIDSIDVDGTVSAGCHTVPWESIEHVARQLGLIRV